MDPLLILSKVGLQWVFGAKRIKTGEWKNINSVEFHKSINRVQVNKRRSYISNWRSFCWKGSDYSFVRIYTVRQRETRSVLVFFVGYFIKAHQVSLLKKEKEEEKRTISVYLKIEVWFVCCIVAVQCIPELWYGSSVHVSSFSMYLYYIFSTSLI